MVAAMPAPTVALMSAGGVGISVGSAADTAACTVAPKSGAGVGVAAGLSPAQAAASISAKADRNRARDFFVFMQSEF